MCVWGGRGCGGGVRGEGCKKDEGGNIHAGDCEGRL